MGHNPYFSGNSFATEIWKDGKLNNDVGHNPYFSGNSFATQDPHPQEHQDQRVTILILVETLLQR